MRIIAVGKDKDRWVSDGCAHYEKLLSRFARLEWQIVQPAKHSSMSSKEIMKDEGERLLARLGKGSVIALGDTGDRHDSKSFAKVLEKLQISSGGSVNLVIGGAYGLDESVLSRADMILSLSPMTFSHQLVRLVLLEQLYRGFSILHGTDYHK
ncbi:MAG: 23S rRNA (pseudouridine(1915)-N(3))-methyltransferase RlmH [candidate division Zixibacteria bacterium]|nr:23S rRNA (pseudouridine(1915)-N(3))-methyltransferase RlmH [candidate division Zixibacteria bacterium]